MRTVAGVLEQGLAQLLDEPVKVTGAGRTDSGVHATGQVISLTTGSGFPFGRLLSALPSVLPGDLSVRDAACVEDRFSARFSALERTYVYAISNRMQPSALLRRYAWHVPAPLELAAMRIGAGDLIGERNFRSFASVASDEPALRHIRRVAIDERGTFVRVEIAANGFLHHMVRTIVGTLVECGSGRRDPGQIATILAAQDRRAAGMTAPPGGLYLAGVRYSGYDSFTEPPILSR